MFDNIYKRPKRKRKTKAERALRKKRNELKKHKKRNWYQKLQWARKNFDKVKEFADTVCKTRIVKSEQWFMELWEPFKDINDIYNDAFGPYVPDLINHEYKYIIEIDGSIHDDKKIQWKKDIKKNEYYSCKNYCWYRIKAYNIERFEKVKNEIVRRRNNWYDPRVNSLKNKGSKAI
jgi:very-short-patch-repair endonuclease